MGAVVSTIGGIINTIISAIATVVMTIVNAIVTVIVAIFDLIVDIICCRICTSRRRVGTRRFNYGRRSRRGTATY